MEKKISIKTSGSSYWNTYRIWESSGKFICEEYEDGFFGGRYNKIGETRSFEDAITYCRAYASKYGAIQKVEFR
ncbi:hypothetical protein [Niabella drilacis]|uniref:Uncharacterized protein n=1 Tax=Niabella drilacis (strain DSM 25811 / CCM 8410 / CCUG 62505 / LMG 26954 / E90) TaxID=1285928 RepID=A0A1G6S1J5_NIADE|nr:hypothetical protein [Niabella drilacis]SDD10046.1 hypothetical protein SAMN04487894_10624 [Niabella drilacis]